MQVHVWELLGILLCAALLCWANFKLLRGTIQNIVYVLIVLLAGFLVLRSLGILPDMGVSVGP